MSCVREYGRKPGGGVPIAGVLKRLPVSRSRLIISVLCHVGGRLTLITCVSVAGRATLTRVNASKQSILRPGDGFLCAIPVSMVGKNTSDGVKMEH